MQSAHIMQIPLKISTYEWDIHGWLSKVEFVRLIVGNSIFRRKKIANWRIGKIGTERQLLLFFVVGLVVGGGEYE